MIYYEIKHRMTQLNRLLELRKKIKNKKPFFLRQDAHKKPKLGIKWRKPKGIHSKMREKRKGYRRIVSKGYGAPKNVRGLDKSGLKPIKVSSIKDILKINKETEGAIISKNLGQRKKIVVINKLKESGIKVLNIDIEKYLKKVEESLQEKKKKTEVKEKKKKAEAKEEKKLAEKIQTEEEKKQAEKKEKDKLLTKRV